MKGEQETTGRMGEGAPVRLHKTNKIMIKSIKQAWWLCLVTTAASGVVTNLCAEETKDTKEAKAPATPEKAVPVTLTGKIVAVNKTAMTVTVDMKGKLGLFKLGPQVKLQKDGKEIVLEDLVAGQEISLTLREISYGKFEVVSVSVEPTDVASEAAGNSKGKGRGRGDGIGGGKGSGKGSGTAPFPTAPVPRNNEVLIISPNN